MTVMQLDPNEVGTVMPLGSAVIDQIGVSKWHVDTPVARPGAAVAHEKLPGSP